jgi:hypothetical protein
MAWFRNHYECDRCKSKWTDEWSAMCDDDCRKCGARHMSPFRSDDLCEIVVRSESEYLLLRSADDAEATPEYLEVGRFRSAREAFEHRPAP